MVLQSKTNITAHLIINMNKFESNRENCVIRVACVGASITEGCGASDTSKSYPSQLAELLGANYIVGNFGRGGRTMLKNGKENDGSSASYWETKEFEDSKAFNPDIVIIMLGTNDSKSINWNTDGNKEKYSADYKEFVNIYRELSSKPEIYISTLATVSCTNWDMSDAVVSGEIVPLQRKIAQDTGCMLVDINTVTKNMPQNFPDGIHPNDDGYTIIAREVFKAITLNR